MRALIVIAALASVASAAGPRVIPLALDRTAMLGGHATVRLAEGMAVVGDDDAAVLDWGAARFTLVVSTELGPRGDPRVWIAADRDLGSARVEKLAAARSGSVYGATPNVPRLVNDRALVYLACGSTSDGTVQVLRFYVSQDGIDDARDWAAVAREIAGTLELRADPSPPGPPAPPTPNPAAERSHVVLPRGWSMAWDGPRQHIASAHGSCDVQDGELDARPAAPGDAAYVPGQMRGDAMYWSLWTDHSGHHAEAMIGAAHQGQLHVQCHATTAAELAAQRAVVEAVWR